jgi:replication factor A1
LRNKISIDEYLAFLSTKYEIDPDKFYSALIQAERNRESSCGEISILRRNDSQNRIIMLITKGSRVVTQVPISKEFLVQQKNPIRSYIGTTLGGRRTTQKNATPHTLHINDLKRGMKQINLKAKIVEISNPKLVFTRYGNYASVSNALIADETGTIKLCLWNEQITSVSIGDTVTIENAQTSTYKGESQLRIGKKGKLSNNGQANPQLEVRNT